MQFRDHPSIPRPVAFGHFSIASRFHTPSLLRTTSGSGNAVLFGQPKFFSWCRRQRSIGSLGRPTSIVSVAVVAAFYDAPGPRWHRLKMWSQYATTERVMPTLPAPAFGWGRFAVHLDG